MSLLLNPWTIGIAAATVIGAWGAGELHGHSRGVDDKQAEWNVEKLRLDKLISDANERANQSAFRYEEWKARQATRTVYITRKVTDANAASPEWAGTALPPGVRDAVAAAASAVDSGQPDRPVPAASAVGPADERGTAGGIRPGPGWLGRVFRPASQPR